MNEKLKFGKGNAKLAGTLHTFSLPAGWTCPGASICKSKVHEVDGKLKVIDATGNQFRCFAASNGAMYSNAYKARQHNMRLLKECKTEAAMARLLYQSFPKGETGTLRLHVSGDFFSQKYFDAWRAVTAMKPGWHVYAYTKSINYWAKRIYTMPDNMTLTASYGGKYDDLISINDFKYAKVVFSEAEAEALGLPIDHDDSYARQKDTNYALLLHGTQPKGSAAAQAKSQLKKEGWTGYAR